MTENGPVLGSLFWAVFFKFEQTEKSNFNSSKWISSEKFAFGKVQIRIYFGYNEIRNDVLKLEKDRNNYKHQ